MKPNKNRFFALAAALILSMTACGSTSAAETSAPKTTTASAESSAGSTASPSETGAAEATPVVDPEIVDYVSLTYESVEEPSAANAESFRSEISSEFQIHSESGDGFSITGNTVTITKGGTYSLTGSLEGNLVVDAGVEDVELILLGCRIESASAAPIAVLSAGKVSITAEVDTFNEIVDARTVRESDTDEELTPQNAGAAIYAACDLTVKGHGALVVSASYNNGIASSDDLKIKNVTLKVSAVKNAIKGNDSLSVDSAQIIAIASGGDGLKTENSSVSAKGNQKGTITITDGVLNIYAAKDGISAAYDVILQGSARVCVFTDTYSDYSEEGITAGSDFYLILSTSDYDSSLDYYACYSTTGSDRTVFVKADSIINVSGGRSTYYGLVIKQPAGYDRVAFVSCQKGATPSTDNYENCTEDMNINTSQNGYLITQASGKTFTGDWVSLSTGSSGKNGQTYSTKGIKAANAITLSDDVVAVIYSTDDGIHANGETLENGESGLGAVTINGGTLMIASSDDGIHADRTLTVNGGTVIVTTAYEGLEANVITINGGKTFVTASDDGVNATSYDNKTTPSVNVNGGYLDVTTPSGDTDAIDSNGNYTQSGGFVLVKGGSTMGSVAGSVDVDGSITVDGGCIIACGGICESPSGKNNAYVKSGTTLAKGSYLLTDGNGTVIASFCLPESYGGFWISCDGLIENAAYTLSADQSSVLSWTQESGTMGSTGNSSFGGGGFGGGGRR